MDLGDLPPDTVVVARALECFVQWLRDERQTMDISSSALSTLNTLDTAGPLRVTELAEREHLTQPGMTTLIHRLESAGFAVREADPEDGRAVRVSITPSGVDRVARHRNSRAVLIGSRIEQLGDQERALLLAAVPALDEFTRSTTASSLTESR